MKVRDFLALQRGDLSVVSDVTGVMGELVGAIDMLSVN